MTPEEKRDQRIYVIMAFVLGVFIGAYITVAVLAQVMTNA